jgi:hypothetical protein
MALKFRSALLILMIVPSLTGSYPSLTSHPHTATNVKWELDGVKDGTSAHNHNANRNFGGVNQPTREPYSAFACWDNTTYRLDSVGTFDSGH